MDLSKYIESIPNFPIEGIIFRDIMPLVGNGEAFSTACKEIAEFARKKGADLICGPESRGFIFGCPVAANLEVGFVPIRKPGKLPRATISESYELEYGKNVLEILADSIKPNQKVVIVDDLLATGGTIKAAIKLIERLGGVVAGIAFLIELTDLNGREELKGYDVISLLQYKDCE